MKFTTIQTNFIITKVYEFKANKTKLNPNLTQQFNSEFKTEYTFKQLYNNYNRAKNTKVCYV
jgi:hypothetical protein